MGCVESQRSVSGPLTVSGIAQVSRLGQQLEDSVSSWWEVSSLQGEWKTCSCPE